MDYDSGTTLTLQDTLNAIRLDTCLRPLVHLFTWQQYVQLCTLKWRSILHEIVCIIWVSALLERFHCLVCVCVCVCVCLYSVCCVYDVGCCVTGFISGRAWRRSFCPSPPPKQLAFPSFKYGVVSLPWIYICPPAPPPSLLNSATRHLFPLKQNPEHYVCVCVSICLSVSVHSCGFIALFPSPPHLLCVQ